MITQVTVDHTAWVAVTEPGESGSCWLDDDRLDFAGRVDCRVRESDTGPPTVDATYGRRVFPPSGNADHLLHSAGSVRSRLYARCVNPGDKATICTSGHLGYQREIDNNPQTQVSTTLQYFLIQELKTDCVLASPISVGDTIFNLVAGHGFTATPGELIVVREGDSILQCSVISVSTNAITACSPAAKAFGVTAQVIRGNRFMNKDFSSVQGEFKISLHDAGLNPWDIKKLIFLGESGSTVPDDGTFFGLPALATKAYLRRVDGTIESLGTFQKMLDFEYKGYDVVYGAKAPSGTNSTNAIIDFETAYGQQKRLDPRTGDYIVFVIRSNLSALAELSCSALGSITSGE